MFGSKRFSFLPPYKRTEVKKSIANVCGFVKGEDGNGKR